MAHRSEVSLRMLSGLLADSRRTRYDLVATRVAERAAEAGPSEVLIYLGDLRRLAPRLLDSAPPAAALRRSGTLPARYGYGRKGRVREVRASGTTACVTGISPPCAARGARRSTGWTPATAWSIEAKPVRGEYGRRRAGSGTAAVAAAAWPARSAIRRRAASARGAPGPGDGSPGTDDDPGRDQPARRSMNAVRPSRMRSSPNSHA